jgi:DNA-directed RNA polymerase specialized sigma24 family protein
MTDRLEVDSPVSTKQERDMTQEAFDCLLKALDADREQAGQKYVRLHLKMVKYFQWRGAAFPDKEADETLNRVARRIGEGREIPDVNAYCHGVARLVFAEALRAQQKEHEAAKGAPFYEPPDSDVEREFEVYRACLDRCLLALPLESREMIVGYYQEESVGKIEHRRRLAARLGIQLNALRIRTHRIRIGLESCVRECIGKQA